MHRPFRRRILWILGLNAVLVFIPLSGFSFIQIGNTQALSQRSMILGTCNASIARMVSYVTSEEAMDFIPVLAPYQRIILVVPGKIADSGWQANPGFQIDSPVYEFLARIFLKVAEGPSPTREDILSRLGIESALPEVGTGIIDGRFLYSVTNTRWVGMDGVSILLFDLSDLLRASTLNKIVLVLFSLVSGLIAGIVSLGYYRLFMRPLFALTLEAGSLGDRSSADSFPSRNRNDEIGELSRAFALAAEDLIGRKEAVENFTSDVLHELKNPLASIRNCAELLERSASVDDETRKLTSLVSREAGRIDRLLHDIKESSEYRERPTSLDSCSPELVIREVSDLYRDQGVKAGVLAKPGHSLPMTAEKFGCVLENLLDNAVDFSPAHETVTVSYVQSGSGGTLTVCDQGRGIPPDEKALVFTRFYSRREGAEADGLHSGLGLAIVAGILESHGAEIVCVDNAPKGCCFVVSFPDETIKKRDAARRHHLS